MFVASVQVGVDLGVRLGDREQVGFQRAQLLLQVGDQVFGHYHAAPPSASCGSFERIHSDGRSSHWAPSTGIGAPSSVGARSGSFVGTSSQIVCTGELAVAVSHGSAKLVGQGRAVPAQDAGVDQQHRRAAGVDHGAQLADSGIDNAAEVAPVA